MIIVLVVLAKRHPALGAFELNTSIPVPFDGAGLGAVLLARATLEMVKASMALVILQDVEV